MNIDDLHEQINAEFGGPAMGALPAFVGDVIRPHKGGGSSSSTTQSIPEELKPLATAYSNKAMDLANQGYQGYGGQQVASPNWYQNAATDIIKNRVMYGDPLMDQANSTMQNALASGNAATANPAGYASNGGANQYAGSNPYLQQNIDAAMGDITRNYNDAVAPGLTTQMVSSGSFGNTGAQASTQNALNDLTKNLGNTASGMRMQDYTTQQGLAESQINRNMQTSQFNSSMGNDYASRNDQMKGQMLNLAPTYGNQAFTNAAQLTNAGNAYQDNQQQQLDALYQNWTDQQNDPYKKLAAMSGVFGSGLGNTATTKQSGGGK
ncbi:hypothetical protein KVG88_06315 [Pseudomonas sp. SWRI74]|uniref:Uncharacterized protein n=1 Tax=Pseudomonas azerbaijanoccidentalis TaxID=2842347 RepID=A0ABS6QL58_9PSED|nr:hypothetical protein [Pseudomonas azerbaijanoccidentalis]MBV4519671.1 hypothetical protein [Pseudomonas azerbaijanoccidentalis]